MNTSSERTVWVRRAYSPLLAALMPVALLASRRRRRASDHQGRKLAVGVGVLTALVSLRVLIDQRGLRVGFGPWGWPERLIAVDRIRRATVERGVHAGGDLSESVRSGLKRLLVGLGYRFVPGGTRIVLGFGDMLVLHLDDDRTFGITVPDAGRAADLVNRLVGADAA